MSNDKPSTTNTRRRFLSQLALGAAALPLLRWSPAHADLPHLTPDDPSAKPLGYTEDASKLTTATEATFKPGSHCGVCALFQGKGSQDQYAGCAAFPGKAVNRNGWCRAFSQGG